MTQPTATPQAEPAEPKAPVYRDRELHACMKALRAAVKANPQAKAALEKAEKRLRYCLKIVETWDKHHTSRAEFLLTMGCTQAANTSASLIFDEQTRLDLYRRTPIGLDAGADERIAEAELLGREVLN